MRSLIADLGDAYCEQLRRTAIGRVRRGRRRSRALIGLNEALGFMPEVRLDGDEARRAGHGVAVTAAEPPRGDVRLTDEHGLVALAEPREQGSMLKPIVGLRG